MTRAGLRLRWSWRDLRARWGQVLVIALILALGTGIFAALGSTAVWRRASNDASFAATNIHDVKVRLTAGTTTTEGALRALAAPYGATAVEERLVWPTQVSATTPDGEVLVTGELVGASPESAVDRVLVREGGGDGALLEIDFARTRDLASAGTLTLSGDQELAYSGLGQGPEYFFVLPQGQVFQIGGHAVLFTDLATTQRLAGQPGRVNDVVLDLPDPADAPAVRDALEASLAEAGLSGQVTTTDDEPAYTVLYEDIGNDQEVWNLISMLILAGASFAAFNLISRIVEQQRRELGIGMALGVSPGELAVRPMLVGAQIALLGVVLGIGVGFLMAEVMKGFLDQALPLPVWRTPFQPDKYALAAAIGLLLPLLATAIPVWRAVRVQPVEAIRTGHFASGSSGWAGVATNLPFPKTSTRLFPIRNLLRRPRRTLLTALAIGASITVLVAILGMLDSFVRTIDTSDRELTRTAGDRLSVQLSEFQLASSPTVQAIEADPAVGEAVPQLLLPAQLGRDGHEPFDVQAELLDFATAPWSPAVASGEAPSPSTGILLAEKAARDLGVGPGDTVTLTHPVREGLSYRMVDSEMRVAGTHALPLRAFAYLDSSQTGLFGLEGITNALQVVPADGTSTLEAQRALFAQPGVAAAVPVGDASRAFEDALAQFTGILRVLQGAVLGLALLIAFNASSIAVDERARENATMFAFGVDRRSVLGQTVVESAAIGVLGTMIGAGLGYALVWWMFRYMLPQTLPDIGIDAYLSPATLVTVVVLGVGAVAIAPLFTYPRLRRMDIPSTLRVVE